MGSTAAPWSLPYPDSTDRPQDGADALWRLADRMDEHLTDWRADDNRLRRRPAAKVSYDSTVKYHIGGPATQATVTYNTVQLDTGGMTDLQRRADRIYLPRSPRPALYMVGGSVVGLSDINPLPPLFPTLSMTSNARWTIDTVPAPDVEYPFLTRDQNADYGESVRGETLTISTMVNAYEAVDGAFDDELWVAMEVTTLTTFSVWYADMWAFWTTDVGTIPST
jgi:hypothetical protein